MAETRETGVLTYDPGRRAYLSLWRGMITFRKTMAEICEEVAFDYEIDTDDIRGPSRVRVFVLPRDEFMARALDAGFSSGQVGRFLTGRDHSTVLTGAKRHRIRMAKRKNHAA